MRTLWGDLPLRRGRRPGGRYFPDKAPTFNHSGAQAQGWDGVFQDFQLFPQWTVDENLRFVLDATGTNDRAEQNRIISEVCTDVQLTDQVNRVVHQLSGGEQQRAVIARAVLNKPQIILADELTGHLDPETADAILQLMRKLAVEYQTAILMATQRFTGDRTIPGPRVSRCRRQSRRSRLNEK